MLIGINPLVPAHYRDGTVAANTAAKRRKRTICSSGIGESEQVFEERARTYDTIISKNTMLDM
jgi:hypothetical protein